MGIIKLPLWWAYLDSEGIIHVKRYTTDRAIWNAEASPLVKGIFDPFEAVDYSEARQKCYQKYEQMKYLEKKGLN